MPPTSPRATRVAIVSPADAASSSAAMSSMIRSTSFPRANGRGGVSGSMSSRLPRIAPIIPLADQIRVTRLTRPTAPAFALTPRSAESSWLAPDSVMGSASVSALTKSDRRPSSLSTSPATEASTSMSGNNESST